MNYYNNVIFLTGSDVSIEKNRDGVQINNAEEGSVIANESEAPAQIETSTQVPAGEQTQAQSGGFFGSMSFTTAALFYVAIFAIAYFVSIRPHKKREKEAMEMRSGLAVGDNVVTSAGLYGKIVDIGGDVFVVEFGTNKGIKIPIAKKDVIAKKEPDFSIKSE